MRRVLITGMSGVGKSSVIVRLREMGYKAVDTDEGGYCEVAVADEATRRTFGGETEWRWREDRIADLLDEEDADVLFVCGTSSNQARFYGRFDRIILLTAPDEVLVERMRSRTNNPYGQDPAERRRQQELRPLVEPLLRRSAHAVIETTAPLDTVVSAVLRASMA